MNIYPAIDLRTGKVVRLKYGDPKQPTTYSDDPLKTAQRWAEAGASWIHVVNLDGAFGDDAGAAINRSLLQSLAAVGPRIQFGGGLRSMADIAAALSRGAARVVIGTLAIEQPDVLREAVERFGSDRVVASLDAQRGRVKTRGWQSDGGINAIAIGRQISIEGQIAAFGRDDDLVALDDALFEQTFQRFSDGAFTALMTIVNGGVDDVTAEFDGAADGLGVGLIDSVGGIPQVRAQPDRAEPQPLDSAEVPWSIGKAIAIAGGPFCGSVSGMRGHST